MEQNYYNKLQGKHDNAAYKSAFRLVLTIAFILLLPFLAMQVSDEVIWDITDFAVFGVLLVAVTVTYKLTVRMIDTTVYRFAVGLSLTAAFILLWVNGAVGIIGTECNDANMMYPGVLGAGTIGSIIARFQPNGMARAMVAIAFAQILVGVIALTTGLGSTEQNWPLDVLALTGFFTALWLGSAWLFHHAAQVRPPFGDVPGD